MRFSLNVFSCNPYCCLADLSPIREGQRSRRGNSKQRMDRFTKTPLMTAGYFALTEPEACTIPAATWAYQFGTTGACLIAPTSKPARSLATERSSCELGASGVWAVAVSMLPRHSKKAPVKIRENECGSDDNCCAGAIGGRLTGS